jgi:hypothetical protein
MAIISIHPERSFLGIPIMDVLKRQDTCRKIRLTEGGERAVYRKESL